MTNRRSFFGALAGLFAGLCSTKYLVASSVASDESLRYCVSWKFTRWFDGQCFITDVEYRSMVDEDRDLPLPNVPPGFVTLNWTSEWNPFDRTITCHAKYQKRETVTEYVVNFRKALR